MEGRYLLGVEPVDRALAFLRRHSSTEVDEAELARLDARAKERRSRRPFAPKATTETMPADADHLKRLTSRELFKDLFGARPFDIAFVDIATLIPVQPHVNFGFAMQNVREAPARDRLLEMCLPSRPQAIDAWGGITVGAPVAGTLTTADLNVTVTEARLDTSEGVRIVFTIGRTAVFAQAIEIDGRLILKNGTHRAVGLLSRGVTRMPCVVLRNGTPAQVADSFEPDVVFGKHPPTIADFLDPALNFVHEWPERTKVIRMIADEYVTPRMP